MGKAKLPKTNVARLLDAAHIPYELVPYVVDESNLSAVHVAEQLGENVKQVYKTLIVKGDKTSYLVCIIAADAELDLKKIAKCSGNKHVEMLPMKDLLSVTGYIRGGCSPIGMKKRFDTYIDECIKDFEFVYVSAGVRGLQAKLSPIKLVNYIGGNYADIEKR
ncbi:MAG: Cys-tRNA(Pro) deacylase [Marinifilaceae bacterium]